MEKQTQGHAPGSPGRQNHAPLSRGLLAKALLLKPGSLPEGGLQQAIVEEDGVFSIHSGLKTEGQELDPALKSLIDSVLGLSARS